MKGRSFFLLAVAVVVLAPSGARASLAAIDHPGSLPLLLDTPAARKELRITSLQAAVLDSLAGEYKSAVRDVAGLQSTTPPQRDAAFLDLTRRFNVRTLTVLNASQREQLPGLEVKVLGASALFMPSVQKSLALDERQKSRIEEVRLKGLGAVGKVNRQVAEGKISPADRVERLRVRRTADHSKLLSILTPAQRATFTALGGGSAL